MSRISISAALLIALVTTTAGAARADVVMDWNNLASVASDADPAAEVGKPWLLTTLRCALHCGKLGGRIHRAQQGIV